MAVEVGVGRTIGTSLLSPRSSLLSPLSSISCFLSPVFSFLSPFFPSCLLAPVTSKQFHTRTTRVCRHKDIRTHTHTRQQTETYTYVHAHTHKHPHKQKHMHILLLTHSHKDTHARASTGTHTYIQTHAETTRIIKITSNQGPKSNSNGSASAVCVGRVASIHPQSI